MGNISTAFVYVRACSHTLTSAVVNMLIAIGPEGFPTEYTEDFSSSNPPTPSQTVVPALRVLNLYTCFLVDGCAYQFGAFIFLESTTMNKHPASVLRSCDFCMGATGRCTFAESVSKHQWLRCHLQIIRPECSQFR